jgi:hypothetical protein
VVVDNFDLVRIVLKPDKANAPLVINPNAVLSGPVASKRLQVIAYRNA